MLNTAATDRRSHALSRGLADLIKSVVAILAIATATYGQGPIIHYTFDEASGPARDSGSGPASDGVLGDSATRTTNTPGMASAFALDLSAPGLLSSVNAGVTSELDSLPAFTLTTWLLLEGLNADQGGSGNVRLLANQDGAPNFDGISWNLNNPLFGERSTDNFRLGVFIGGEDGFSFAQSTESVGAESWTFLAVTFDGLEEFDNVQFYAGDELGEVNFLGLPLSVLPGSPTNSAEFGIGFTGAEATVDFSAVGFQDDVRVYNRALTLEELEQVRLENLAPNPTISCDFDGDDICGLSDVNLLTSVGDLTAGVSDPDGEVSFDLDLNGVVNTDDLFQFLADAASRNGLSSPYLQGDTDLDGTVAFSDFLTLADSFGTENANWEQGDFNGDGQVAFSDFLLQSENFGKASVAGSAVPEPSTRLYLCLGLLCILRYRFFC